MSRRMSSFALHQRSIYQGPNLYTPAQAIRWTLSRKDGEDWPGAEVLAPILPPLIERLPALADRLELQPDSSAAAEKVPHLAELLMHLAMVLQAEAWHPAEMGCAVPGPGGKTCDIICEYMDPAICQQAMAAASSLVLALTQPSKAPAGKISQILQRLMDRAERLGLDQTTRPSSPQRRRAAFPGSACTPGPASSSWGMAAMPNGSSRAWSAAKDRSRAATSPPTST